MQQTSSLTFGFGVVQTIASTISDTIIKKATTVPDKIIRNISGIGLDIANQIGGRLLDKVDPGGKFRKEVKKIEAKVDAFNTVMGINDGDISKIKGVILGDNKVFADVGKDLVNLIPYGSDEIKGRSYKDLDFIPFKFYNVNTDKSIVFRAILSGITDTFTPEYSSERYIGRPDNVYVYTGTTREISFTFEPCFGCYVMSNCPERWGDIDDCDNDVILYFNDERQIASVDVATYESLPDTAAGKIGENIVELWTECIRDTGLTFVKNSGEDLYDYIYMIQHDMINKDKFDILFTYLFNLMWDVNKEDSPNYYSLACHNTDTNILHFKLKIADKSHPPDGYIMDYLSDSSKKYIGDMLGGSVLEEVEEAEEVHEVYKNLSSDCGVSADLLETDNIGNPNNTICDKNGHIIRPYKAHIEKDFVTEGFDIANLAIYAISEQEPDVIYYYPAGYQEVSDLDAWGYTCDTPIGDRTDNDDIRFYHPCLVGTIEGPPYAANVICAGEIFKKDNKIYINNGSGHYQPNYKCLVYVYGLIKKINPEYEIHILGQTGRGDNYIMGEGEQDELIGLITDKYKPSYDIKIIEDMDE